MERQDGQLAGRQLKGSLRVKGNESKMGEMARICKKKEENEARREQTESKRRRGQWQELDRGDGDGEWRRKRANSQTVASDGEALNNVYEVRAR